MGTLIRNQYLTNYREYFARVIVDKMRTVRLRSKSKLHHCHARPISDVTLLQSADRERGAANKSGASPRSLRGRGSVRERTSEKRRKWVNSGETAPEIAWYPTLRYYAQKFTPASRARARGPPGIEKLNVICTTKDNDSATSKAFAKQCEDRTAFQYRKKPLNFISISISFHWFALIFLYEIVAAIKE